MLELTLDTMKYRGQIYTQFDARWVYILCVALFEAGSAICGAAPNMNALIIGRVICGLGGGGMYTGVMVLLSANTTEQERPSYFGEPSPTFHAGKGIVDILQASQASLGVPVLVSAQLSEVLSPTHQPPGAGPST